MSKLTNKQKAVLSDTLYRLKQAQAFIKNDDIEIRSKRFQSSINKEIGSELNYLYKAISNLEEFIETN